MKPEIVMAILIVGSICLPAGALTHKIFFAGNKTASVVIDVLNSNLKALETILNKISNNSDNMMTKVDSQHQILKDLSLTNHDQTLDLKVLKDASSAIHRRFDGFKEKQQAHETSTRYNHKELMKKEK